MIHLFLFSEGAISKMIMLGDKVWCLISGLEKDGGESP